MAAACANEVPSGAIDDAPGDTAWFRPRGWMAREPIALRPIGEDIDDCAEGCNELMS
jgi:hypothetical protein